MKTIVVVDDELPIATLVADILEEEGYEVQIAANGRDALALVRDLHPDLILSDVMMPLMGGPDFCHILQQDRAYGKVPIIFMSALPMAPPQAACQYAAFLRKPFEIGELIRIVQRCFIPQPGGPSQPRR